MDLPELAGVAALVARRHGATRFRWRFRDGPALFEAFYADEPLLRDGLGSFRPLIVSCVDSGRIDPGSPWSCLYRVRRNGYTGMLFADPTLPLGDYRRLRRLLGIEFPSAGPAWSPASFLSGAQASSGCVAERWDAHRIRAARDLPALLREGVEESEKVWWCGWRQNPEGTHMSRENYLKTMRWLGLAVADACRLLDVSTKWTDDRSKAIGSFPEDAVEYVRDHYSSRSSK